MLQITSINFKSPAVGRRAIVVKLNNGHEYKIKRVGDEIKTYPAFQDEERYILNTVYSAAWGFLNGDEPGTQLDMEAYAACGNLAMMFDWDGAGYASEYDDDLEAIQVVEMADRVMNFMDI